MRAEFPEIARVLREAPRIAVVSHARPDGDALGSTLALGYSLQAEGREVLMLNEDGVPEHLAYLPGASAVASPSQTVQKVEGEAVVVALDCANRSRLGEGCLQALSAATFWINLDHHISNEGYGDLVCLASDLPATGQLLYEFLTSQNFPIPPETRDGLFVAISTDTGSFQYSSTNAETFRLVADLLDRGLDVGELNRLTYHNHPQRKIALLKELLQVYQLRAGGRLATTWATGELKSRLGLLPGDTEDALLPLRAIDSVVVAVFFEELPSGEIRVSARSKSPRVDVCALCHQFGGGGHALAAGARLPGPLETAREAFLNATENVIHAAHLDH
ncbi:MAG: DHH family phosphoesterase [Verrucomicrobiota bacterium]